MMSSAIGTDRPLAIDEAVEHVVGAEVSDHRLFVLEPLDIRPSFLGEPPACRRRVPLLKRRAAPYKKPALRNSLRPLDWQRAEQHEVGHGEPLQEPSAAQRCSLSRCQARFRR
jgi:hypothetical protein